MKGSLKLRPKRVLNRKEAWACFSANLALPGSGSLAAGYTVGYAQLAAAILTMILSLVTAVPMIQWAATGGMAASQSPLGDPFEQLSETWRHVRWPLASMGLFAGSILWATMTSLAILAKAPKEGVPPRIT
jgi:hypothetical protein